MSDFSDIGQQIAAGSMPEYVSRNWMRGVDEHRGEWGHAPKYVEPETTADRLNDPIVQAAIAGALYDLAVMAGEAPAPATAEAPPAAPVAAGNLALTGVSY